MTFAKQLPATDDGYGNTTAGAWTDQFTTRARLRPRIGGESVIAARLEGTQPVIITVRADDGADAVTTDWRITDARSGEVYNIRSIARDEKGRFIDFLCESGVAV